MFSSPVLSGCFVVLAIVATTTLAYPTETKIQPIVKVITIDDVNKLKNLPQGTVLTPLSRSHGTKALLRYTLGENTPSSTTVASGSDSYSWDTPQNVQLTLEVPSLGANVKITYVQIDVNQSSNEGQAYVVDGGLGESFITIVLEAFNTLVLEHVTEVAAEIL